MKKYLYIAIASISVGLGFMGMFLPIMPTTPFLLLALGLYMKSSKDGVKMLLSNRYLAPYIRSYFSRKGIPKRQLKRFLLTLWLTLGVGMVIFHTKLHVIAILAAVGAGVSAHLYSKHEK